MGIVGDASGLVTATVAVVAVCGGYVQFVLKRSLLPCVEFDVEFHLYHRGKSQAVGEVACVVRNVGPAMATVQNIRAHVRYRLAADSEARYAQDQTQPHFPHSLTPGGDVALVWVRTFVQPGVTQRYAQPVALPADVHLVDLLGSFDYKISLTRTTRHLVRLLAPPPAGLDWRDGIRNHTARRTYLVAPDSSTGESHKP